jgi:hypothetical protein
MAGSAEAGTRQSETAPMTFAIHLSPSVEGPVHLRLAAIPSERSNTLNSSHASHDILSNRGLRPCGAPTGYPAIDDERSLLPLPLMH